MDYVELIFSVSPKEPFSDILITELADLGFDSFVDNEVGFSAYVPSKLFSEQALESILSVYNQYAKIRVEKKEIKSQNWNKEWEKNYDPIFVADKCCVRAPFHTVPENIEYDIVIEPKMSFGTGHHETTTLMITHMLALTLADKSLLDMGCGTGVLAILAGKMGAAEMVAIDIDEWAYRNTLENVKANQIKNISVLQGDANEIKGSFDFILANINKNVLLSDLKKYCKLLSANGKIIMSGFFESDMEDLQKEANNLGLLMEKKLNKNNWVAAVFCKKN